MWGSEVLLDITRCESPKVIREKKSRDFDVSGVRSPRTTKRERGEVSLHKAMFEQNNWSSRFLIENDDFAKGAYGKVILATDRLSNQRVVLKKIAKSTPIKMINAEVQAGQKIPSHENIPAFIQYYDRPDCHYLVFQYVDAMDLFTYLERVNFSPRSEAECRSIITQVLYAVKHVHDHNVAHRDVKLENILLERTGKVWLIDFGLCSFPEDNKPVREWCGSDNYLAPEIVRRIPYNPYKTDVFSAGVVLFSLVFGVFPFENLRVNGAQSIDSARPLRKLTVRFPSDVKVSSSVKQLLTQMLEDDPDNRISMNDVLAHEWMTEMDVALKQSSEA